MNQTTNAGIDLDKLEVIAEHLKANDFWESGNELLEMVARARRAEPSVAADEHEEFNRWFHASGFTKYMDSMWAAWQARAALASPAVTEAMVDACYDHPERVPADAKRLMRETLERAFVASPAVSQKDDSAEFLTTLQGAAKEATDEWIAGFVRQHFGFYEATTASASDHADWCIGGDKGPCNCRATAPNRDASQQIKTWQERLYALMPEARDYPIGVQHDVGAAFKDEELADLRAALALARAPLPGQGDAQGDDAQLGKWLIEQGFKHADVDLTSDGDGDPVVIFHPRFYIPEPVGMSYDDGEWTVDDIRAAIRAAMSASQDTTREAK